MASRDPTKTATLTMLPCRQEGAQQRPHEAEDVRRAKLRIDGAEKAERAVADPRVRVAEQRRDLGGDVEHRRARVQAHLLVGRGYTTVRRGGTPLAAVSSTDARACRLT